jgi:hypothetical protein
LLSLDLHQVDLAGLAQPLEQRFALQLKEGRLSGKMTMVQAGTKGYRVDAHLESPSGLVLQHPLLAPSAIGPLRAGLYGSFLLHPAQRRLDVLTLKAFTGALQLELKGSLASSAGNKGHLALNFQMPTTPCQEVLSSIPRGLIPKLQGMVIAGEIGLKGGIKLALQDMENAQFEIAPQPFSCKVLQDPVEADVSRLKNEVIITVSNARGRAMPWKVGLANPYFTPLPQIADHVKEAFILAEDIQFYRHQGLDRVQLQRAFLTNLHFAGILRGASTISQQVVKNIFLDHSRTLSRKLQEAALSWRMEQVITKPRILELYLNLVEMGPGIFGVGQAARHYFSTSAKRLSPFQAAQLATLTPSPRYLGQRLSAGQPLGTYWEQKLKRLLRLMNKRKLIGPDLSRAPMTVGDQGG